MLSIRIERRILTIAILAAAGLSAQQGGAEVQDLPPRAAPSDYQVQAKVGNLTIAADFVSHALPTMQGPIMSEDFVAIEVAFFGPPGAQAKISHEDFSIRINDKKTPIPSQPYGRVMKGLSDPEWIPPAVEGGSKGGISTGGGGAAAGSPKPDPPKMPFPLRRAMEQRVQKSVLAEGDRTLPQAGLVFFPYRGKDQSIHSVEVIYNGTAGKATLAFTR